MKGIRFLMSRCCETRRDVASATPTLKMVMIRNIGNVSNQDHVGLSPVTPTMTYMTTIAGSSERNSVTTTEIGRAALGKRRERIMAMLPVTPAEPFDRASEQYWNTKTPTIRKPG